MTKIVTPHIVKRAVCAIVDFAFAFLFGLGVFTAMSAILTNTPYGKSVRAEISSYYVDSGLYFIDDSGNPVGNTISTRYEDHYNMLLHYYTVYIASECPEEGRSPYDVYWFNVFILGLDDAKGQFTYYEINDYPDPRSSGSNFFRYQLDDLGNPLYDEPGTVRDELREGGDPTQPLTQESRVHLLWYFFSDTQRNCDYNAGYDLTHRPFFTEAQYQYELQSTVIPLVTAVVVSCLLFFLAFPLIFKDGQTLGKKVFGFGVVSYNGYAANKGQILLRQFPPIALAVVLFAFASGLIAAIVMGILLIASYIMSIFSNDHRAIHDLVAYTFVIDLKESTFYRNPEEEALAERIVKEDIKKIKNPAKDGSFDKDGSI